MTTSTTTQLNFVTTIEVDQVVVTATVVPGGYLPENIFLYQNLGTIELGRYLGVCNTDELTRTQVFTGVATPLFGNAFLRWGSAKIVLKLEDDASYVINHITKTAQQLSTALKSASGTQIVTIT